MQLKYSLDDLRYFCMVAKLGSFKQAAQHLDIPLSTLSRRIYKLEQDLQLKLLHRNAHKVALTHSGEYYYLRSSVLFDELNVIGGELYTEQNKAKGKIRVTAPNYSGTQFLRQFFYEFLLKYPQIQLDLKFSNNLVDIEAQGIDVAFRIGDPKLENWIARKLKSTCNILCAPLDFPEQNLNHPKQLAEYASVICHPISPWQMLNLNTKEIFTHQKFNAIRLEVDQIQLVPPAIKMGLGISFVPDYIAQPMIENNEIKHILPTWQSTERHLSMLYRDRTNMPYRVRLFIDFIVEKFSQL